MDYELLFAQTIGIIAVINGHYDAVNATIKTLFPYYAWHMPFFIFISGILFARTALKRTFIGYIRHKCAVLLIPGLFIHFCYGILAYFMKRYQFLAYGGEITLYNLFVSPFLLNYQFLNDVSLWFIFQLFIIEMAANIIFRSCPEKQKKTDIFLLIITFCVSVFCMHQCRTLQDLSDVQISAFRSGFLFFFFVLGIIYERYLKEKLQMMKYPIYGCYTAVLLHCLLIFATNWNNVYNVRNMAVTELPNSFIPYLTFAAASVFVLCLARYLSPLLNGSRLLKFIGPNLRYVVYHHQFCGIMIGFTALILKAAGRSPARFNPLDYMTNNWYSYAFSRNSIGKLPYVIIPFIVPIFIARIINKTPSRLARFAEWCLLMGVLLVIFTITGRYYQEELRLLISRL